MIRLIALIILSLLPACSARSPGPVVDPERRGDPRDRESPPLEDPAPAGSLKFWKTCGDVVCSGFKPRPGVTACSGHVAGEACTSAGELCYIAGNNCNQHLLCKASNPAQMCPRSRRVSKRAVRYLKPASLRRLHDEVLKLRLASWSYRSEPEGTRARVGFIIDDAPQSPAVLPNGNQVDVYGYASMAIASLQVQAELIEDLQRDNDRLAHLIEDLREQAAARDMRIEALTRPCASTPAPDPGCGF